MAGIVARHAATGGCLPKRYCVPFGDRRRDPAATVLEPEDGYEPYTCLRAGPQNCPEARSHSSVP